MGPTAEESKPRGFLVRAYGNDHELAVRLLKVLIRQLLPGKRYDSTKTLPMRAAWLEEDVFRSCDTAKRALQHREIGPEGRARGQDDREWVREPGVREGRGPSE